MGAACRKPRIGPAWRRHGLLTQAASLSLVMAGDSGERMDQASMRRETIKAVSCLS